MRLSLGPRRGRYGALNVLLLFAVLLPATYAAGPHALLAQPAPAARTPGQLASKQVAVLVHGRQGLELDPTKYNCNDGIQGPDTSNPPQFGQLAQTQAFSFEQFERPMSGFMPIATKER